MASKIILSQNNDDGIVTQTLNDISDKVCAKENCGALTNTADENRCTSISDSTVAPCENMVPSDVRSEMNADSGYVQNNNDFAVVGETLAEICDEIDTLNTLDTCSNCVDGLKQAPVAVKYTMSSAELQTIDNKMITENGVMTSRVSESDSASINEKECIVRADVNCEVTTDVENGPCTTHLISNRSNLAGNNLVNNNLVNNNLVTDNRVSNNLVTNNLVGNNLVTNNLVTNNLVTNNLVNNNHPYNKQSISTKLSVPNKYPSVSSKQNLANGKATLPDDLLFVISVVEEEISGMGISTVNGGMEGHQLTNGESSKVIDSEKKDLDEETASTDEGDSSEDSSSSSNESSDESDPESKKDAVVRRTKMAKEEHAFLAGPPKTKDEICLSDLPDIEPLDTYVDESVELSPLGEIESILLEDAIVIIKSFENVPALDTETILFLEDRSGFGRVFEIFGQVKNPHYCIRFNNEKEIKSTNIEIGQSVYFAPDTKDLTTFVFVSKLKSIKGSDASWEHDQEPPSEILEYSDDEAESSAKSAKKRANKMKKRNEAHMQDQFQGQAEAANSVKKQRPSAPHSKDPIPSQTRSQQQGLFHWPPRQQLRQPTPKLQIPPQFTPREPHRFGKQHIPFHPPPRGPPLQQPICQMPPQFTGEQYRLPPRNYMMPHSHLHPRQHFGPPGAPQYEPPPQFDRMWGQPFQNFTPPPQPNLGTSLHNSQLPPQHYWDGPLPLQNVGRGAQSLGPQPLMTRYNTFPNRPPVNQHQWPRVQPPPIQMGPPYVKEEPLQNTQMSQCQYWGEPPENVKAYLNT